MKKITVPLLKAKAIESNTDVVGYYYQQPLYTPYCFDDNPQMVPIEQYLAVPTPGDWGLAYSLQLVKINPMTLEVVGEVNI